MANTLADSFSERAGAIDKEGRFPFENFEELKNSGYVALTVPAKFGGTAIDLYEFVMLQERIATG
ncbi:acyl-CoA dehydrogenase family protein, partial [Pantoea sp. SIMBA_133]